MAEIIPLEPDPGNAGVGNGKTHTNIGHILEVKKGMAFLFLSSD